MRNLKKVLSLVLALAMVLSLCMVGAGAVNYDDFTDEGTITKKQAVETLVSLNVILGYNGGNTFAPSENVKRSEMATMICRVLAGGDNMIVDATKPVATFADIDGHWAESYIEYCTSLGIVSGKSPTSFDPDANVTAAEAAKMVMTTLGYNADVENFKGIGWDINTMAKANTLKLLDNLQGEISASVPVTREQVAQMLFNALTADMVQNYVGSSANVWISSGAERYTQNLLEAKFNAEKVTGVVVANEFASLYDTTPLGKGKTTLHLLDDNNDITETAKTVNLTTGQDDLGMSVIVYCDKTTSRVVFGDTQDTGLNAVQTFTNKMDLAKGSDAPYTSSDLKGAEYFINYSEYLTNTAEVDHYFRIGFMEYTLNNSVITPKPLPSSKVADKTLIYRIGDELDNNAYDQLRQYIETLIAKEDNPNYQYTEDDIAKIGDVEYIPVIFEGRGEDNKEDYTTRVEYSSWKGFSRYYLANITSGNARSFDGNENGNYLKAVDANGDGAVDYVMKVEYTMAKVSSAKKGDLVLTKEVENITKEDDVKNPKTIKGGDLVSADEFAPGDVIVYFEADGVYYANLAETVTGVPTHVNYKTDVVTVDGTEYTESGITVGFNNPDDLFAFVDYMTREEETYNLFLDNYGYVRGWEIAMDRKGLVLLTRANTYKQNTSSASGFAVEAYDNEDGKIHGYDLNASRSDDKTYIRTSNSSFTNDWDKLIGVPMVNGLTAANNWDNSIYANKNLFGEDDTTPPISLTNMAAANINEDGVMTIQYVDEASNKDVVNTFSLAVQDMVNDSSIAARRLKTNENLSLYSKMDDPDCSETSRVNKDGSVDQVEQGVIYTNSDTVYYVVNTKTDARDNRTVVDRVRVYTGYGKLPSTIKAENIDAMYAVATLTDYNSNSSNTTKEWYYTADAVVIETHSTVRGNSDVVFLYDTHTGALAKSTTADIIDNAGVDKEISLDKQNLGEWVDAMGFYRLYDGNTVAPILEGEYSANGIYAGTIHTHKRAEFTTRDSAGVIADTLQLSAETPVYTFSEMTAASKWDNVKSSVEKFGELSTNYLVGKDIIWYENKDGVQFIIDVTDSFRSKEPAPKTALNAPALGMAFDNGFFAKDEAGYREKHYEQTELYHVWSHVINEPVYEQYKKLVDAWTDYTNVVDATNPAPTADAVKEAKAAFKAVIDQVEKQLEKKGGYNNYTEDSDVTALLKDVNKMLVCEINGVPGIWDKGNDDTIKALDNLVLTYDVDDAAVVDAAVKVVTDDVDEAKENTVITGETPIVKFYGVKAKLNGDTFTVEVSHKTALEWTQKEGNDDTKAIVLSPGTEEAFEGELATEALTSEAKTYNATIQGPDGKVYKVVATKKVQDQTIGELQMTGNSDGISLVGYNIPGKTITLYLAEDMDYTLASLAKRIYTNRKSDTVTVTGYDADNGELPDSTLISAAINGKVIVTITNDDLYKVELKVVLGDEAPTDVTITLGEGVKAWTDAECTSAAPAGSAESTVKVSAKSQLWFTDESGKAGSFTVSPGTDGNTTIPATYVMKADANISRSSEGVTASAIENSTVSFTANEKTDSAFKTFTVPAGNKELAGATVTENGNTKLVEYTKDVNVDWNNVDAVVSFWLGLAKMPDGPVEGAVWAAVEGRNDLYFDDKTSDCMSWTGFPCVSIKSVTAASGADHTLEVKTIGVNGGGSETWTVNFKKVENHSSYVAYFLVASNNAIQISLYDNDKKAFLTQEELGKLGITAGETDGTYETSTASITVKKTPVSDGQSVSIVSNSAHWRPAGGLTSGETLSGASQAGVLKFDISSGNVFTESTHSWYTVANGFIEGDGSAVNNCKAWTSDAKLDISLTIDGKEIEINGLNGLAHAECDKK